jgi:phosphonoacetate hydrolase
MHKKTIFVCLDGCGPKYIEQNDTPNIDKMTTNGFYWIGNSVIPSVTNVNNVSIVTGSPLSVHGITSQKGFQYTVHVTSLCHSALLNKLC